MFELKKIISAFITIPGIFIFILIVTGLFGIKKKVLFLKLNIVWGILLYCFSISFITNRLIGLIEDDNLYNGKPEVRVMILLGGGTKEGVRDISGTGIPSYDMTVRVADTVRLYKKYKLPILFSGGSISKNSNESLIVKRYLIDLGVPEKNIMLEDQSMDTVESALYVRDILQKKGYKKGLLVTSGYHMKRSLYLFRNAGLEVYPHSCGLLSERKVRYYIYDFLPGIGALREAGLFSKESIGLFFYYIKYGLFL